VLHMPATSTSQPPRRCSAPASPRIPLEGRIVGPGGLGHLGVKFAKDSGAHEVVVSTDAAQMAAHAGSFGFIFDAASATPGHLNLLKRDGDLTLIVAPEKPLPVAAFPLLMRRRSVSGSLIGGQPETQETLDFCGRHNITGDFEVIRMDQIDTACERILKSGVKSPPLHRCGSVRSRRPSARSPQRWDFRMGCVLLREEKHSDPR
jgi:D-arabinose 1-dehydrogenase-like Zn-dependent alcohol dehydrogenase